MKGFYTTLGMALLTSQLSFGATIAIIDSGTDTEHKDFTDRIWVNPDEVADNQTDDDGNGFADDVNGWNFAGNNNEVIDYRYERTYSDDIKKFFEIQTKILRNEASDEEMKWVRSKMIQRDFLKNLTMYATYAHGTHVTGIALGNNEEANTLAIKLLQPPPIAEEVQEKLEKYMADNADYEAQFDEGEISEGADKILKFIFDFVAKKDGKFFSQVGQYVKSTKADIANGSFGTSSKQVRPLVAILVFIAAKGKATKEQIDHYSNYFMNSYVQASSALVSNSPDTLFVFAAGNDGTDNDKTPVAPANIQADNSISVAATMSNTALASFSNFGAKMVDVAAPGTGILSAVPRDKNLVMSGTSQAAPYVAYVAGMVKDANPKLTPVEVKRIVMGTVDKKTWLEGKVAAGGLTNAERALEAGKLSVDVSIDEAIESANEKVADQQPVAPAFAGSIQDIFVAPLPSLR